MDVAKNIVDVKTEDCPLGLVSFNPKMYAVFVASLIFTYVLYRHISKLPNWERRDKTLAVEIQDISQLIVYGTLVFVFGNYSQTFNQITFVSMIVGAIVFGWLGTIPFMKNSLAGFRDWSTPARVLYGVGFAVIAVTIVYIVIGAQKCNSLLPSIMPLILPLVILLLMIASARIDKQHKIHPHHWQILWAIAFVTRFNTPLSKVLGGISIGIFVQGISAYGPDLTIVSDN